MQAHLVVAACTGPAPVHALPAQPFLGTEDPLLAYFPDRYYAVALPAVLLVAGVTLVMAFVGVVMMKTAAKKAKKAAESKKDA